MADRRKKAGSSERGAPMWVVTFGDLMSLLLTFFVLLLSFSVISEEEFKQAAASIRSAFGVMPLQTQIVPLNRQPSAGNEARRDRNEREELARRLRHRLQMLGKHNDVQVAYDRDGGIKISLPDTIMFESGQAQLVPDAYPLLHDLAVLLNDIASGAFVEVRGHTDDRPVGQTAGFRDNFDLSYQRAYAVAQQLVKSGDMPYDQIQIVAAGAAEPIATNTTDAGQRANRRVDIHVRGLFTTDKRMELEQRMQEVREHAIDEP
jgi:chemotaxis protein MotB